MPTVTPFLWFDSDAEDAANFYLSIFPDARKLDELRTTEAGPGPKGSLLTISIELAGQKMTFLNGGPNHPLTDAFSFFIACETQQEIDRYWAALTTGGQESRCGWLTDKFGLSWQVAPANIFELVSHPQGMRAMMKMVKLDIATLERAASES
jgi:predicted 3-demethylubiquinone-9 3-methyltransferase (glyoxalase superfamily)